MTTDAWGNRFEYVSESIASSMTEMADEIRTLRARLAEVEAERDLWHKMRDAYFASSEQEHQRAEAAEAEIEFMRAWCADHYGVIPPTREQNAAFMRALDEMEENRGN